MLRLAMASLDAPEMQMEMLLGWPCLLLSMVSKRVSNRGCGTGGCLGGSVCLFKAATLAKLAASLTY